MTEAVPVPPSQQGENVQAVRDAIEAMRSGQGTFEDLRKAVQGARFAVRPAPRSDEELADNWDYVALADSFTDTVMAARWQKVLTPEQVGELRGIAQFASQDPSRLTPTSAPTPAEVA